MPSAFPATVAEREAELVALQSAFDEYIASSRELEEELDAELAKMRKSWIVIIFELLQRHFATIQLIDNSVTCSLKIQRKSWQSPLPRMLPSLLS